MSETKNYKDTLNLPQTSFPMKASLAQREPEMLSAWEKDGVYSAIRKKSTGKKKFILHDGPPYANGHIHIGHSLNKILKDIIVKYKTMRGFDALYIPGWDCHGLPIEYQCLKDMGKRKDQVERVAFRKEARKYAEKFVQIQKEEFKRLGVFGEWEQPYLTMAFDYQASIAESFLALAQKDFIYQGLKPVPWCFDCETALADAELEYKDKTSTSVYVKFPVKVPPGSDALGTFDKPVFFLAWTTTPWTLPANVGVAVHPDLDYSILEFSDEVWVLAQARVAHLESLEIGMGDPIKVNKVKGRDLKGVEYRHPFLERNGKTILADYVSATDGTGIVHIAPGHGEDDYRFGHLENGLDIISPVDHKGLFTDEFELSKGVHVFKANDQIVELLTEKNLLLGQEAHQHSYPHCWRCKKPIIFRATKQWFMKIDHENLRKRMSEAIEKKIKFTPDWGKNRIGSMVESRPEWCLSRQRYWGVPIPVITCPKCPGRLFVKESKDKIVQAFREHGADEWFVRSAEDFLPKGFKCPGCGGNSFNQETDIIDVWFDSGVSHQAVLKTHSALRYPADLYLEGSDQHRGWFQSALTTGIALDDHPPFDGVLTHGFVVDGEGRKMSKSAGNVVAPQDVMKEFGADILRLWVSSCDYQFDVRLSAEILKQMADAYRKIRNTFRYLLGNLYDFDPNKNAVAWDKLHPLDQWAVGQTQELVAEVTRKYDAYDFHEIYQWVHNFCVIHLSSYYLDVLKDTLYTAAKNSWLRRSAQTALFYIVSKLVKILAPILPFTMEEVWKSCKMEHAGSVHESEWQPEEGFKFPSDQLKLWSDFYLLRNAVTPFLEKKREEKLIGSSLDAQVRIHIDEPALAEAFKPMIKEFRRIFVVSDVVWQAEDPNGMETASFVGNGKEIRIKIRIEKAPGKKCVRCWNYSTALGKNSEHPELCEKCLEAVSA